MIPYKTKGEIVADLQKEGKKIAITDSTFQAMNRWGDQEFHKGLITADVVTAVFQTSANVVDDRDRYKVLASLTEEVGELALEIKIAEGDSYKEEGKDGIIGEAVDVIVNALDMIFLTNPNFTVDELVTRAKAKCHKWQLNTPYSFLLEVPADHPSNDNKPMNIEA